MTSEHFPSNEQTGEAVEHERLLNCFKEGVCPHCGDDIDEIHANDHYGFCTEKHKYYYETDHSLDVSLDFKRMQGQLLHERYLKDQADTLDIPVELFRKLHDEEHKSPAEIRTEIERYRERKAA